MFPLRTIGNGWLSGVVQAVKGFASRFTSYIAPVASGSNAVAIGTGSSATGTAAFAAGGINADATGPFSTAVGSYTLASGPGSVAIGPDASASQEESTAIGSNASCSHVGSVAIHSASEFEGAISFRYGVGSVMQTHWVQSWSEQTEDATPIELVALPIPENGVISISGQVVAANATATEVATWDVRAVAKINGSTEALVFQSVTERVDEGADLSVAISAGVSELNETKDLIITITGNATDQVYWGAMLHVVTMTGIFEGGGGEP